MRPERASTHEAGGDRGVSLVLVALLAVAVLLLAAVAIDGGSAYANRRQMQNAADAGAFAGTRAVEKLRFGGETDGGTIWDAVESTRETNDADSMRCWLVGPVTTAGTPPSRITADVCTDEATMASAWASLPNGGDEVAGVEVEQTAVRDTYFARVTGNDTTTARASAIATLQPLAGTAGGTPFLVCSSSENDADGFDIWDFDTNRIRPGAITDPETGEPVLYGLQGAQNEKVPDCGAGSDAFDGTGGETPAIVGQWTDAGNGNGFDQDILSAVVGSDPCTPDMDVAEGCLVVLPLISEGRKQGANIEMFVVGFGVFEVYGRGSGPKHPVCQQLANPVPKYCGYLIGPGQIDNGTGGTGPLDPNNPYLIKLVQ
jgi:hypothetical protein